MATSTKPKVKKLDINSITVNKAVNFRESHKYDTPGMASSIIAHGRILVMPWVEELKDGTGKVIGHQALQGCRRIEGGQAVCRDPNAPQEVKDWLTNMEFVVTPPLSDTERFEIMLDHDTKGLGRVEIVNLVWRMKDGGFNYSQIANKLFYLLAKYTKNESKIHTLPEKEPERSEKIHTWFRGSVDMIVMQIRDFPRYVQEAFILMNRIEDGEVKEKDKEGNVLVKVDVRTFSQKRCSALKKAMKADEKSGEWSHETGGPEFNALWTEYKKVDSGEKDEPAGPKRLSVADLEKKISNFHSKAVKIALTVAKGEPSMELADLDLKASLQDRVFDTLYKVSGNGGAKPEFKDLLKALIQGDCSAVESLLSATH